MGGWGRADQHNSCLQWTSTECGSGTMGTSTSMPAPSRCVASQLPVCGYLNLLPLPYPQGYSREVSYLVTQHPLVDTRYEFWLMVLQHRVNTVAMVGPLDDRQPQTLYWQTDHPLIIKGLTVTLETEVQSRGFRRLDFTVSAPMVSSSTQGSHMALHPCPSRLTG